MGFAFALPMGVIVAAEFVFAMGVDVRLQLVLVVSMPVLMPMRALRPGMRPQSGRIGTVLVGMGVLVNMIVVVNVLMLMAVDDAVVGMRMGVDVPMGVGVAVAMRVTVIHVRALPNRRTSRPIIAPPGPAPKPAVEPS